MTIEQEIANRIVHQERIAKKRAETGGEQMHPDHYAIREGMRLAVLTVLDEVCMSREIKRMSDAELPALFRTIDAIANRVFLASVGLSTDTH